MYVQALHLAMRGDGDELFFVNHSFLTRLGEMLAPEVHQRVTVFKIVAWCKPSLETPADKSPGRGGECRHTLGLRVHKAPGSWVCSTARPASH